MRAIIKVMLIVLPAFFLSQCEWLLFFDATDLDEAVYIPDHVFLSTLVEKGVDTNGDGEISHREARLIDSLDIGNSSFEGTYLHIGDNIWCHIAGAIKSLEGIEAFKNLRFLDCGCNQLTNLDLSMNTCLEYVNCCCNELTMIRISGCHRLKELICSYNPMESIDVSNNYHLGYLDCSESNLKSLDVSHNPELLHLDCSDQEIPELDVTNCPDLKSLNCHNNLIQELNLSNNHQLTYLWTQENQLSSLDISQNSKLTEIQINDIPELYKVCVWVLPFPPSGVHVSRNNSPNAYFTTDCSQ